MAMATARIAAQPPSVKCRICGRPSLRRAKLCDQCVAAVKRARHVNTITSEFLPQPVPANAARPPLSTLRASPQQRPARWSWLPTKPAGWTVLVAFSAFAAAVVGTAYLAVQESADRGLNVQIGAAADPSATRAPGTQSATDGSARTVRTTDGASSEEIAKSADSVGAPQSDAAPLTPAIPQSAPLPDNPSPRKSAADTRKKLSLRTNPPHASEVSDESKALIAAPEPAVAPPSAPAPAPAARVPDRWETMNAALAACSSEGFLAGVMCTERVRYQYCEGYWGQVPQCRAATRPGTSR